MLDADAIRSLKNARQLVEQMECVGNGYTVAFEVAQRRVISELNKVLGISDVVYEFLRGTAGVIEATTCEHQYLWQEFTTESADWVSDMAGIEVTVGGIGDMPVYISLRCAVIRGHKIVFYHATSQVVDHRMIREWLDMHMPQSAFDREGERLNRTDATNFYNVFPRTA